MNQEELQKIIAEYYQKLPQGAQRVFAEMKWLADLRAISQKYSLSEEQIQTLGTETTLVLLGVIHLEEYEEILARELGLGRDKSDQLTAEIDEKILRNIRGDLNNSYSNNLADIFEKEVGKESNNEGRENQANSGNKIAVKIESKMNPKFSSLPANVLEAVKNSNYQDELYKISEDNDLSIEQMGLLEESIAESFLGEIQPAEFGKVIKSRLNLAPDKVNLLVNQINEKILKEIRRKIMGNNSTTNKTESPLEINTIERNVMQNAGFTLSPQTENKVRDFNANDYKESYMKNAGIAVEKEKVVEPKKEMPQNNREIMQKAGIKIVDAPKNINIFSSKLNTEVKTEAKETDHSFKNLSNQNNSAINIKKNTDPYRTPIE